MGFVPTTKTEELGLTATIPFIDIATATARATGVSGINQHQGDTRLLCFVGDKGPQGSKAPIGMLVPLTFANRDPVPQVRQLFQHQRGLRVFRQLHKLFGYPVVDPALKPGLCACHRFQASLGTLRPSCLKRLALTSSAP